MIKIHYLVLYFRTKYHHGGKFLSLGPAFLQATESFLPRKRCANLVVTEVCATATIITIAMTATTGRTQMTTALRIRSTTSGMFGVKSRKKLNYDLLGNKEENHLGYI